MTLALLLACAGTGATLSAWGLGRGRRASRAGALAGVLALVLVLGLAVGFWMPAATDAASGGGGLFDGLLVPGEFARLLVILSALGSLLVVFVGWLAGGLGALRGLLPASLAFIAGGTVAVAATDPALAAVAAAATGLAAVLCLGAGAPDATTPGVADSGDHPSDHGADHAGIDPGHGPGMRHGGPDELDAVAARHLDLAMRLDRLREHELARALAASTRELRITLAGGAALLAVAAMTPIAAELDTGVAASPAAEGPGIRWPSYLLGDAGGLAGLLIVVAAVVAAVRLGAIPFHLRVPRLIDAAPPHALPLLLVAIPVPMVAAALMQVEGGLAQPPGALEVERWLIVAGVVVTLVGAALAAFIQDDLRHLAGYLVIAAGAPVLLGLVAGEPVPAGAARTWLVVFLASQTALLTIAAAIEARFESRSAPDIRGWLRRAPILGIGLALAAVATYGLPGWAVTAARADLVTGATSAPWDTLITVAALATLPAYVRLLALGVGPATSRVLRAAPELTRIPGPVIDRSRAGASAPPADPTIDDGATGSDTGDVSGSGVTHEGAVPATRSARARGSLASGITIADRVLRGIRHEAALLTSLAVLGLAVLAVLVSAGTLGAAGA